MKQYITFKRDRQSVFQANVYKVPQSTNMTCYINITHVRIIKQLYMYKKYTPTAAADAATASETAGHAFQLLQ